MIRDFLKTKENIEYDILSDIDDIDVFRFVLESLKHETDAPYSALLQAILHYNLNEKESKKLWTEILENQETMEKNLGRKISIKTSLVDYFNRHNLSEKIVIFFKDNLVNAFNTAMRDGLTGLYSHAIIHIELEKEFQMAQRYNLDLSIMFIDIDNFKIFNDQFGHKTGDRLLIKLSDILEIQLRKTDKIGRYGGEEFLVILPHTRFEDAMVISKKLLKSIYEQTSRDEKIPAGVTVSIGVAGINSRMKDGHDMIEAADIAMYRAKKEGKNRVYSAE